MRLTGISKSYDGVRQVLKPFDFEITKGDRIAIVGVNGAGKTTFSKIVAGADQPTGGTRELGHNARVGYYSQDHADALDPTKTVLETIEKTAKRLSEAQLRTLLGCFLFRGDDVFKLVKVLSGGERGRLALANMLLTPANFLVLDEPTNHLDMRSQAVLQQALLDYTGSYMIVSHNRDFLDPVVTKTLEFRVGESPRLFPGNLSYYLEKKAEERAQMQRIAAAFAATSPSRPTESSSSGNRTREQKRLDAQRRQEKNRVLKPLREKLEQVEADIAALEAEKAALTARMNAPGFGEDAGAVMETTSRYADAESALERAYSQWSDVSEAVERAEKEFVDV